MLAPSSVVVRPSPVNNFKQIFFSNHYTYCNLISQTASRVFRNGIQLVWTTWPAWPPHPNLTQIQWPDSLETWYVASANLWSWIKFWKCSNIQFHTCRKFLKFKISWDVLEKGLILIHLTVFISTWKICKCKRSWPFSALWPRTLIVWKLKYLLRSH